MPLDFTPLVRQDRVDLYIEIMLKLDELKLWDLSDRGIKRFKVIMNLWRDTGREFNGEVDISSEKRTIIYKFYNTRGKKTNVYISQDRYRDNYSD